MLSMEQNLLQIVDFHVASCYNLFDLPKPIIVACRTQLTILGNLHKPFYTADCRYYEQSEQRQTQPTWKSSSSVVALPSQLQDTLLQDCS
jgi:hypothetical protein